MEHFFEFLHGLEGAVKRAWIARSNGKRVYVNLSGGGEVAFFPDMPVRLPVAPEAAKDLQLRLSVELGTSVAITQTREQCCLVLDADYAKIPSMAAATGSEVDYSHITDATGFPESGSY